MAWQDEDPSLYLVRYSQLNNNSSLLPLVPADPTRRCLRITSNNIGGLPANSYLFCQNDPNKIVEPFIGNNTFEFNWTNDYSIVTQAFGVTISATNGFVSIVECCFLPANRGSRPNGTRITSQLAARIKRISQGLRSGSQQFSRHRASESVTTFINNRIVIGHSHTQN